MAIHLENVDTDELNDSPIITFFPIFTRAEAEVVYENALDKQYAIRIGCLSDTVHDGISGALSYFSLFEFLASDGYDPLKPIRGEKIMLHIGREIGKIIYRKAAKNRTGDIYGNIRSYAVELAEFVRDYIYGSISIPNFGRDSINKDPLDKSTVYRRRSKFRHSPWLYRGESGISEPLFETGRLCESIKWKLERVDVVSDIVTRRSRAAIEREAKKRAAKEAAMKKTRHSKSLEVAKKQEAEKIKRWTKEKPKVVARTKTIDLGQQWLDRKDNPVQRYYQLSWSLQTGRMFSDPNRTLGSLDISKIKEQMVSIVKDAMLHGISKKELEGYIS